jgi:hypothetical protein
MQINLEDFDIEELLRQVAADEAARKLRRARPWTYDIIRALWGPSLTMDTLTITLWEMRNPSGLPMPKQFTKTVQSFLNRHTSQSSLWDGKTENDLFFSPKKKGSGTWAVHKDRAIAWLRAKRLPAA